MRPSSTPTTSDATLRGTPAQGLFGATLGFFIGFAAVALFGPTANKFKDVMHLTPVMIGFLVAMPSLSGSLLRIPFSAWVDTDGGRKPFVGLLGLSIQHSADSRRHCCVAGLGRIRVRIHRFCNGQQSFTATRPGSKTDTRANRAQE